MDRTFHPLRAGCLGLALALAALPAASQTAGRSVPARTLEAPPTVSPQIAPVIAAPFGPMVTQPPKTPDEWRARVAKLAGDTVATLPALRQMMKVKVEPGEIAGVKVYTVTPETIRPGNENRLLYHIHGGGYVLAPGEAGTREAILMAGYYGAKVVSVDYRMPPDHPHPAAMNDTMAVWAELVKSNDPQKMAIFGTSTGGGMTLAAVLLAKQRGLPLPAAIAPGTPWSDLTKTGDSYFANDKVDNILVDYESWLGPAALLYANGVDLKDPVLSPIYGDFTGFPPAILTSGTRDLFLSNTVRTHRKLRQAGVEAELHVFEAQSHAQYYAIPDGPETKEYHAEVSRFFDRHLKK
jgi:acetyl esterase/lipase